MDLKDYSNWVEMELLHLEVSAAFLHSHNHTHKKRRESHGFTSTRKITFSVDAQTVVFLLRHTATKTEAIPTESRDARVSCIKHVWLWEVCKNFRLFYLINWSKKDLTASVISEKRYSCSTKTKRFFFFHKWTKVCSAIMLAVLRCSGAEKQLSACCYGHTDRANMLMLNRCVNHVQL